jgi:hypothetical protein
LEACMIKKIIYTYKRLKSHYLHASYVTWIVQYCPCEVCIKYFEMRYTLIGLMLPSMGKIRQVEDWFSYNKLCVCVCVCRTIWC